MEIYEELKEFVKNSEISISDIDLKIISLRIDKILQNNINKEKRLIANEILLLICGMKNCKNNAFDKNYRKDFENSIKNLYLLRDRILESIKC